MTAEAVISDMVRKWTETVMPGDAATADAAVVYALGTFARGASVSEACDDARRMVVCRSHHPSSMPAPRGRLAAAS